MTRPHLIVWAVRRLLLVALAAFACSAAWFAFASFHDGVWTTLSPDAMAQCQSFTLIIAGFAVGMFLFMLLQEALERRGFLLSTAQNDEAPREPWPSWALKNVIITAGVGVMLMCPVVLAALVFHAPQDEARRSLTKSGVIVGVVCGIVLVVRLATGTLALWWNAWRDGGK